MTTAAPIAPRRPRRAGRRLLFPGDLITLPIALGLLLLPALSLNATGWALQMPVLVPTIVLSIAVSFLVARSQYGELLSLVITMLYGACFIVLFGALAQPGGIGQGLYAIVSQSIQWTIDAFSGGINQDDLVFTLLVCGLFWFLGFNLSWHLFRVNRLWRAVLPPGVILILNGIYTTGPVSVLPYLIAYVFLVLILVVRSHIEARAATWAMQRVGMPTRLRRQLYVAGIALAVLLLGAWMIPTSDVQERLNRFQEFLASEPLQQLSELWLRLFSSAEMQGPATSDYYGGESLQLGGAIRLGDEIALYVNAPTGHRYYWRSRVYDFYDMGRWTSAADTRLSDPQAPFDVAFSQGDTAAREAVSQQFTLGLQSSRLVYAAPQPQTIDLAVRADMRYAPDRGMIISAIRPWQVLNRGDSYTVTSQISVATADQLNAAGTAYPDVIRQLYLTPVPSVTPRTAELAQQIVTEAGATTPYAQAKAIETWLRLNIAYDERIPQPPAGQDPVDWLLFDNPRGYCNYYASAMVVMLRSLGVPARMAAGFAQGTYDPVENAYIARERDAHTWVEVYFPGYGWVEFEPTAAQEPLNRGDLPTAPLPPADQPTRSPTPSPTPTPSPSPTAPPTQAPTATATASGEESNAEDSQLPPTPTFTATPTSSPTPQPAFVPTPPPPQRPERPNPFDFILPALSAGLALLLLVVALMGVVLFIYWWWEWRGMRGLSPISRAYARLERYVPLIGVRTRPQQTPEERRRVVVQTLPTAEPPVSAITTLYTSERYGPPRPEADDKLVGEVAGDAWADARESILRRWLRRIFMPWKRR